MFTALHIIEAIRCKLLVNHNALQIEEQERRNNI